MQLLGDDDVRVRENAAACLCRFVIQNAKQQTRFGIVLDSGSAENEACQAFSSASASASDSAFALPTDKSNMKTNSAKAFVMETLQTNFNLLWDFFDYRIFCGMSLPLRNLFKTNSTHLPSKTGDSMDDNNLGNSYMMPSAVSAGSEINAHAELLMQRQIEQEEKVLAKVLYRLTNTLMTLSDKNMQVSSSTCTNRDSSKNYNYL